MYILVVAALIYFGIGVLMTAFCVHMSYHEAAIGFGDSDDFKVQKVLESKIGPLGMIFLFTCWPLALLIAFRGKANEPRPQGDVIEPRPDGSGNVFESSANKIES
ncbi:MAG TPA: hypothetical protein VKX17_27745 [Planctomycetota bacterium]|nr:hypothetical protein [Planctomycetota bacterium]